MKQRTLDVVILAGGRGSRMGQQSQGRQKCLTLIQDRPIVDYLVRDLIALDCGRIIIVKNHLGEQIDEYVKTIATDSRLRLVSTDAGGTAGALCSACSLVSTDPFLYMHGDMYYDRNLIPLLQANWRSTAMTALISTSEQFLASTHPYVLQNCAGKVERFVFPGRGDEIPNGALCSMETILMSQAMFPLLNAVGTDAMLADALGLSSDIYAYVYDGRWFHLENPTDLKNAQGLGIFGPHTE